MKMQERKKRLQRIQVNEFQVLQATVLLQSYTTLHKIFIIILS